MGVGVESAMGDMKGLYASMREKDGGRYII